MSSSTGHTYTITTFGESHGPGVGVTIDGLPAGFALDLDAVQKELARRKPGQNHLTTQRKEGDELEVLSGMYEGRTLGTPLAILIRNSDQRSKDYDRWAQIYRPSHADYTYHIKYGYRTPRGGGRASVRETIGRVAAGAIAAQILKRDLGMQTIAWVDSIGEIDSPVFAEPPGTPDQVDASLVRCPHEPSSQKMIELIEAVKKQGDSVGGVIGVIVRGVPPGLGEPVFDKLEAELAKACLSISACKGFESGSGFRGTRLLGSEHNDIFYNENAPADASAPPVPYDNIPDLQTKTNHSGGIQGGITNGMPVLLRLAFKPVATIHQFQDTVNEYGAAESLRPGGRHDPCVLPRAVPIVEAVVNNTLLDAYLRQRARNPEWWLRFVRPEGRGLPDQNETGEDPVNLSESG